MSRSRKWSRRTVQASRRRKHGAAKPLGARTLPPSGPPTLGRMASRESGTPWRGTVTRSPSPAHTRTRDMGLTDITKIRPTSTLPHLDGELDMTDEFRAELAWLDERAQNGSRRGGERYWNQFRWWAAGDWPRAPLKCDRPRCGARTRAGRPCQAAAAWDRNQNRPTTKNARCRMHGGTLPSAKGRERTIEGLRRRWARWRAAREGTGFSPPATATPGCRC